jgi:16S rRNA (guanine527-N7)-methyltransferase
MDRCREILLSGLDDLGLILSEDKVQQLLDFVLLMEKWNKAYNLTAIRNRAEMVQLHLLDSLTVLPYIKAKRVIDIGTGAGLPGIPLAICMTDVEFTLLDSNAKKTRFVQQAVLELKLKNVAVCHSRVQAYRPQQAFDVVLTRAFARIEEIIALIKHLLDKDGVLLAMKGQMPDEELESINAKVSVIPVHLPGVDAKRCLVKIEALEEGLR